MRGEKNLKVRGWGTRSSTGEFIRQWQATISVQFVSKRPILLVQLYSRAFCFVCFFRFKLSQRFTNLPRHFQKKERQKSSFFMVRYKKTTTRHCWQPEKKTPNNVFTTGRPIQSWLQAIKHRALTSDTAICIGRKKGKRQKKKKKANTVNKTKIGLQLFFSSSPFGLRRHLWI